MPINYFNIGKAILHVKKIVISIKKRQFHGIDKKTDLI